jgi:hypothetical protein
MTLILLVVYVDRSSQQSANTTKTEYNLNKRLKTRWEPVTVHESDGNQGRPNSFYGVSKDDVQGNFKDTLASPTKQMKKDESWSKINSSPQQQPQVEHRTWMGSCMVVQNIGLFRFVNCR